METSRKAGLAWAGIFGFIGGYDYWAIRYGHETLSGAFWRHSDRHHTRILVIVGATLLYKHLVAPDLLPQVDPLKHLARRWHANSVRETHVTIDCN